LPEEADPAGIEQIRLRYPNLSDDRGSRYKDSMRRSAHMEKQIILDKLKEFAQYSADFPRPSLQQHAPPAD